VLLQVNKSQFWALLATRARGIGNVKIQLTLGE
jgi:hypothetical protein